MGKKFTYRAKATNRLIGDDDAQVIGDYVVSSFGKHDVGAEDFVLAARSKSSPIHPYLPWDDKKAAHEHRLHIARQILAAIEVKVVTTEGEKFERAFYNVQIRDARAETERRGYVRHDVVKESPDFAYQVRLYAWKQLQSWRETNAEYEAAFSNVFIAIDAVTDDDVRKAA